MQATTHLEFFSHRILSSNLVNYSNQQISVFGWLHKKRSLGSILFIILRDRAGLMQVVLEDPIEIEKLTGLHQGTVLTITGTVRLEPRAQRGVEVHANTVFVDTPVLYPSPIEIDKPIDHSPENLSTLFEYRVVNMRNTVEQTIFKVQTAVQDSLRSYLKAHDFTEFHSPKLLAGSTEGGAEVFKLEYFGQEATLAQSAQFYKQILVGAFERVFEFGATYRAEPSVTTRHMTEFITLDVEMGFITGVEDVLKFVNKLIYNTYEHVWQSHQVLLKLLGVEKAVLSEEFPVITLSALHELCYKHTGQDFRAEKDPSPFEERWICEYARENWNCEAVFITGFPASDMKFYQYRNEEDPAIADRFDLLFKGVEIITGSRREHRYEKLIEQLVDLGGNPEANGYKYYLQAFKYGLPAHGGFGLGLERLTQKIIGLNNVKEATIFPRDTSRLAP